MKIFSKLGRLDPPRCMAGQTEPRHTWWRDTTADVAWFRGTPADVANTWRGTWQKVPRHAS